MAKFRHISTKLVLALDAGNVNGKKITKRVTISNIREDASADALWELAEALGKLLAYPVAEVRLYKVEELVRGAGDGTVDKNGGVHKEADTGRETETEATATADTQINYDAAARDGSRHNVYTAARAFGGRHKNGLLRRSCNGGYAGNRYCRALTAALAGQYTLTVSSLGAEDGAATPYQAPLECTRPPPFRESVGVGCY